MFSIYISLFNVQKNKFPYQKNLGLAAQFADEVVVAVNTSTDDSLKEITEFSEQYKNIKIIQTDFSYNDIRFDGAIKNAALQATTQPLKIQMDADEYIPLSQKKMWTLYGEQLLALPPVQCLLIPSVDLYGSTKTIRSNSEIGLKFRMHKAGLFRGIMSDAWVGDRIRTDKSDTTELIDTYGRVPMCARIVPPELQNPLLAFELKKYIYTIHEGYLSFEHRVNINKAIWKKAWEDRSGHEENTPTDVRQLQSNPVINIDLPLE